MKWKALLISVLCLALALGTIGQGPTLLFILASVLFFSIWAYKIIRDLSIVVQARLPEDTPNPPPDQYDL